jgi:hypothetical protein
MSKLRKIKERAAEIASQRDGEQLGPDRGTMDQEEARIERAKQEARKEAKRERTQERIEQAKKRERERVLSDEDSGGIVSQISDTIEAATEAVDDNDGERTDDLKDAFASDFDGDGETLAEEFGLQSAGRADQEDQAFETLGDRLDGLENELGGSQEPPSGRRRDGGGGGGVGGGGFGGGPPAGLGGGGGGFEPIDPEDFGFGDGDSDDGGGFFGGGGL